MPPSDSAFWGSSIFQQEQGWAVRIFRGGDRDGGGEVEKKKKTPISPPTCVIRVQIPNLHMNLV